MLKFVCLIVLVVGACTAKTSEFPEENSTDDGRIFGGSEARRGQFPHQVSLRRNNGRTHFCGGTILSGHIILTAGQCTHKMRPQNLRIVVGTLRVFGDGRQYAIFKIMNHPNFHLRSLANDISVLRTTLRIRFSNYVRSIPLPTTDVAIAGNFNASHSGWGQFRVSHLFAFIATKQPIIKSFSVLHCSQALHRIHKIFQICYNGKLRSRWAVKIVVVVWGAMADLFSQIQFAPQIRLRLDHAEGTLAAHWYQKICPESLLALHRGAFNALAVFQMYMRAFIHIYHLFVHRWTMLTKLTYFTVNGTQ